MKQYPMIGNYDDNDGVGIGFDEDNDPGDIDNDEDNHQEDDTPKEETSPNEACYFDVDPIEPSMLIPLNDSQARNKAK